MRQSPAPDSGGGGGNGPLTILVGDPVNCVPSLLPGLPGVCAFTLSGTGADTDSGTIIGTDGVDDVTPIVGPSATDGNWTTEGGATCTADGRLVVSFGAESAFATVNCGL